MKPHPFRIRRPGDALGPAGPLDLVVEGGAFGSGTHATTVSCLAVLAEIAPLDGLRILDLGSGSGILALAALRLGAAAVLCADVNPDAVESARRAGIASGLDERLVHRACTATSRGNRSISWSERSCSRACDAAPNAKGQEGEVPAFHASHASSLFR